MGWGRLLRGNCQFYTAQIVTMACLLLQCASAFMQGWYITDLEMWGLYKTCIRRAKDLPWICTNVNVGDDAKPDYWITTQALSLAACIVFCLTGLSMVVGSCGRPAYSSVPKIVAIMLCIAAVVLSGASVGVWWLEVGFHTAYSMICGVGAAGLGVVVVLLLVFTLCLKQYTPYPYADM